MAKALPKAGEIIELRARVIRLDESPHYETSAHVELLDYATTKGHGNTYDADFYIREKPDNGRKGVGAED
jgi:hypothetical protein